MSIEEYDYKTLFLKEVAGYVAFLSKYYETDGKNIPVTIVGAIEDKLNSMQRIIELKKQEDGAENGDLIKHMEGIYDCCQALVSKNFEIKLKHFKVEVPPTTLEEAFEIYRQHGHLSYLPEIREFLGIEIVSDLLGKHQFIEKDINKNLYYVCEWDEDYESIRKVGGFKTLDEAYDREILMEVDDHKSDIEETIMLIRGYQDN